MRNGYCLPDSVTVAHVVLVHSVEVRILVGQPEGAVLQILEGWKRTIGDMETGYLEAPKCLTDGI